MAVYQAKSNTSLLFSVSKDEQNIGQLSYKNWFSFKAAITTDPHSTYQVEPKGFWGTTIELKDGETVLLKFKMNWNGEIVIQTFFDNKEKGYVLKHRGIFKESFLLKDQDGTEVLVLKPSLKWNLMKYEYEITSSDVFERLTHKELLLLTTIHCANYYMSMILSATI